VIAGAVRPDGADAGMGRTVNQMIRPGLRR
jgi:hypothetical protein